MDSKYERLHAELIRIGLTEKEAAVYIALLHLGPARIVIIAKHAGLKRAITYVTLEALARRGYVAIVPKEKVLMYMALTPEFIYEDVQERARRLTKFLPVMMDLFAEGKKIPKTHVVDGVRGMLKLYHQLTKKRSQTITIDAFVSPGAAPSVFDKNWEYFQLGLQGGWLRMREIFTEDSIQHPYLNKVQSFSNHQGKIVSGFSPFVSDTLLIEGKVILFSYEKSFAVVIESPDLYTSFLSLFEVAWSVGRPLTSL